MTNLSAALRRNPYCEVESPDGGEPDFDLVAKNLERYRWYGPILGRDEERDLIRRAQAGDPQAKERLLLCHARTVLNIAGQYYGLTRDDLAAAGFRGLLVAIERFRLSRTTGLFAYAESWIRKFINAEIKRWSGVAGETRADRALYSHPGATAEELAARAKCSLRKAEEAIAVRNAIDYPEHYSTTESCDDDLDGTPDREDISDNPPLATSHAMLALYDAYNPHKHSPQLLNHKILGRWVERAAEDAQRLTEWSIKEYHRPCFVKAVGLVGKTDRNKISRREYALMLVERDLERVKAWADESLYRYRTDESVKSRVQAMERGRFSVPWEWLTETIDAHRHRKANLPPARPHHKPKIRHSIIRGRQITIEEKRHVRR
jgi:hypothetical protein